MKGWNRWERPFAARNILIIPSFPSLGVEPKLLLPARPDDSSQIDEMKMLTGPNGMDVANK